MPFCALEQLNKLYDGYKRAFCVNGHNVLLLQEEGKLYIIENRCPHMDVALEYADILPGQKIRCRAHGIEFDLNSGRAGGPLADSLDCLKHYTPVYHGSSVGLDI